MNPTAVPRLYDQQAALLQALRARTPGQADIAAGGSQGDNNWIAVSPILASDSGLKAYKNNAGALAERVLVAAYPAVTAILSLESMGALARALWHSHPPRCGDLARWGGELPEFVAASSQLAALPWLADVARLEWALHKAASAADDPPEAPDALELLRTHDPDHLGLRWASATTLSRLDWSAARIVHAHRPELGGEPTSPEQLGDVWAAQAVEWAVTWRQGLRPRLRTVDAREAMFLRNLQAGSSLLAALEASDLDFAAWFPLAWRSGWIKGVSLVESVNRSP